MVITWLRDRVVLHHPLPISPQIYQGTSISTAGKFWSKHSKSRHRTFSNKPPQNSPLPPTPRRSLFSCIGSNGKRPASSIAKPSIDIFIQSKLQHLLWWRRLQVKQIQWTFHHYHTRLHSLRSLQYKLPRQSSHPRNSPRRYCHLQWLCQILLWWHWGRTARMSKIYISRTRILFLEIVHWQYV